jgi:hypothetical protein
MQHMLWVETNRELHKTFNDSGLLQQISEKKKKRKQKN